MNDELIYRDTCQIYETTPDEYGTPQLGTAYTLACLFVPTTAYSHGASRDTIGGTSRMVVPPNDPFVLAHAYRLEEMVVEYNPFGAANNVQLFKITSVTPVKDLLLYDQVRNVECALKKVEISQYVS
jgi:hypothetical protein